MKSKDKAEENNNHIFQLIMALGLCRPLTKQITLRRSSINQKKEPNKGMLLVLSLSMERVSIKTAT